MKKRQRLYFILFILLSLAAAVGLSLYALKDNIAYFYTPLQVKEYQEQQSRMVAVGQRFRLGGLVKVGSLQSRQKTMEIFFVVTDEVKELAVQYKGVLPDLFREGQGVVATGSLNDKGIFVATEILAKHDENYKPPELVKGLENAARKNVTLEKLKP